jgi:hypothetical protein
MFSSHLFCLLPAAALIVPGVALGQSVVSARSGAIHHIEGRVLVDNQPVQKKFGEFPNLAEGSLLRTELGRAEVLLTPGVLVRLGEASAMRMLATDLKDTRLELVAGTALVEAMEIFEDNAVTVMAGGAAIEIVDHGLYRITAEPPELRVYKGKARVTQNDETLVAKKGRSVALGAGRLAASRFDTEETDALYRWSARRSAYLAMANVSAAKTLLDWGVPWRTSGWYWNPYFGMLTFIPASGLFHSPFGYSFWSPSRVFYVYAPPQVQGGWGGGGGGGRYNPDLGYVTVTGRSAPSAPAPAVSPGAAAAPAESPRMGGSASPRGEVGGGRGR